MILIFAGDRWQADQFARGTLGLQSDEYKYIDNVADIVTMPRETKYIKIGTYYRHYKFYELDNALKNRGFVELEIDNKTR